MKWLFEYIFQIKRCLLYGKKIKNNYDSLKVKTENEIVRYFVCFECRPATYDFLNEFGDVHEE